MSATTGCAGWYCSSLFGAAVDSLGANTQQVVFVEITKLISGRTLAAHGVWIGCYHSSGQLQMPALTV
jgi:hypothetical protein